MSTPSPPQKSETVLEVPADVHRSRYNAMEGKQREAAKAAASSVAPIAPTVKREKENIENPVLAKQNGPSLPQESIPKQPSFSADKTASFSGAHSNGVTSALKDDLSNETDPVKLERKRRQQQKKEEFLQQQLKRRKSDDNVPGPSCIKSEETSDPIPEGLCFMLNSLCILPLKPQKERFPR